jgi:hypothetical protein
MYRRESFASKSRVAHTIALGGITKERVFALILALLIFTSSLPTRSVDIAAGVAVILLLGYGLLFVKGEITESVASLLPVGACILFYVLAFLISGGVTFAYLYGDLVHIMFAIGLVLTVGRLQPENIQSVLRALAYVLVPVTLGITLISFIKFYMLLNGEYLDIVLAEGREYGGDYYPWGTSLVRDYNIYSMSLIMGLCVAANVVTSSAYSSRFRSIAAITVVLASATVILAGSRRGYAVLMVLALVTVARLAGGAALAFSINLEQKRKGFRAAAALIVLCALIAIAFAFGPELLTRASIFVEDEGVSEVFETVFNRFWLLLSVEGSDTISRSQIWSYALTEIARDYSLSQMLFGNGFAYLFQLRDLDPSFEVLHAHNPIVGAFMYSGLTGATAVLVLLYLATRNAIRVARAGQSQPLLLLCVLFAFIMVSGNSIFSVRPAMAILIFMLEMQLPQLQKKRGAI